MALGSENIAERKAFHQIATSTWKKKVVSVKEARELVEKLRQPIHNGNGYAQRKIRDLEGYIEYVETNTTGFVNVFCRECGVRLYDQDTSALTFAEYSGLMCKSNCKKL